VFSKTSWFSEISERYARNRSPGMAFYFFDNIISLRARRLFYFIFCFTAVPLRHPPPPRPTNPPQRTLARTYCVPSGVFPLAHFCSTRVMLFFFDSEFFFLCFLRHTRILLYDCNINNNNNIITLCAASAESSASKAIGGGGGGKSLAPARTSLRPISFCRAKSARTLLQ